ncbi:RNA polymerase sigma factor [Kutzneria buriramensis]|uniref:DNA-directed RNA polymerase specialized sigma24 family protein n=1 Tax=Kutzneria buriramensis TaxID=1045776 RepID=A0A3E0IAP6_9PSEU|nr:sigma-70 family RNA polymerase sigma factor [Kutzneria buriramensis]REH55215.1 hypothetical protein BCF44_101232 [Kutzneria buriramensis]
MGLQPGGARFALQAAVSANLQPEVDGQFGGDAVDLCALFMSPTMLDRGALVGLAHDLTMVGHGPEAEKIRKAADNLAQREADATFYNRIVAAEFAGADYQMLIADLISYAFPTLLSWLRRGTVFGQSKQRGRPVFYDERDLDELRRDKELREELAYEIIAEAIKLFRTKGLDGTGWSIEGGAALTTYFVGSCLAVFPGVWRRWRREQQRERVYDHTEHVLDFDTAARKVLDPRICADPADVAAARDLVRTELAAMKGPLRDVAELIVLHGCTLVEAASQLGTTPGAVEQRLRRYRNEITRRRKERVGT